MATDFQRQRPTVRSQKTLATAGFLSALLAVQTLEGCAMPKSTRESTNQPSHDLVLNETVHKKIPGTITLAPLINENAPNRIPGQYIVIFKPDTPREVVLAAQKKVTGLRSTIRTTYMSGLIGFSAELSESALQALRAEPSVNYIEVNQTGQLNTTQCDGNPSTCLCGPTPPYLPCDPVSTPPKGLDRTSERGILPLMQPKRLDNRYSYSEKGKDVHIYVIDTGIRATHTEFGGRVSGGMNVANTNATDTGDCNGHGTQVAGIIGGATVGIAKNATLHPVRANGTGTSGSGCGDTTLALTIAAVQWITDQKNTGTLSLPAVVNLSSSFATSTALNTEVTNSINSGIPYVIAAGNYSESTNSPVNACNWSPASINNNNPKPAIVVGAIDPATDTRWSEAKVSGGVTYHVGSNVGPCLSLFAPGKGIKTTFALNDTSMSDPAPPGTSFAAAHVTGVVARILGIAGNSNLTPGQVWDKLHYANNIYCPTPCQPGTGTDSWQGVFEPNTGMPITGSPNEMLHYGSLSNGYTDGDPHITTVNGIHYDFQDGGEFVALRDANGMEIQTRQTPVAAVPWVSVNTAVAARVGKHRVTWQPNISGKPDPSGLQLRVDGVLTTIEANGLDLGDGGRVMKSAAGETLEVNFPDGTALFVTASWWANQSQWYLNVRVFHTPATEGIMGVVEPDSWLQQQFADTWRVTDQTSLFDYAPRLSTKTFTLPSFPKEKIRPVKPKNKALAQRICRGIVDKNMLKDCLFDVAVTGDPIFEKSLRIDQKIQRGATYTTVSDDRNLTQIGEEATFTATVARHEQGGAIPTGRVTFLLDGKEVGRPVKLESNGQAQWKMLRYMMVGDHHVAARYIPDKNSVFQPSSSLDKKFTVEKGQISHGDPGAEQLSIK